MRTPLRYALAYASLLIRKHTYTLNNKFVYV